jgi:hypothetical protein
MGKTYKKQTHRYDDEQSSGRSGKHAKHSNNKKSGGMKTLNSYVDEDIDLEDDVFDDDIEMTDEIDIQHIQNNNP